MADAFGVLRRDHEKVERTLTTLEDGPNAGSGADQVELIARSRLARQLAADEVVHEAVEEQCFWPVVRERMPGGDAVADEAARQEQEARQVLARLERLEAWDDGFEQLLREFVAAARDHVAFEETKVWPGLREVLSAQEVGDLGEILLKAKEQAAAGGGAQLADLGYRPNVNQVRHEPMPASHEADQRQEAVVRSEQLGSGQPDAAARAARDGGAPSGG